MASEESGNNEEGQRADTDEESTQLEVSESDIRSVFVGNVHFKTTVEELKEIFGDCGTIERITIAEDKQGFAKGYAFIEFKDPEEAAKALELDGVMIKQRKIKVIAKRTNKPGMGRRPRRRGAMMMTMMMPRSFYPRRRRRPNASS